MIGAGFAEVLGPDALKPGGFAYEKRARKGLVIRAGGKHAFDPPDGFTAESIEQGAEGTSARAIEDL
jgi:hypothetical protein